MSNQISNHILEIRFKPNSRFLDNRGAIAAQIAGGKFDHWNISNNRIDFASSESPELSAFFSFRNLGITSQAPVSMGDFLKTAEDYTKSAWQYFETNNIIRLGVRSSILIETPNFTKAFEAYKEKFLKLSGDDLSVFGGDLVDVGFPLDFVDGDNSFKVTTGPMEDSQSKGIFREEAFPVGIYIEVDYFTKEVSPHIIHKHVIEFLQNGTKKAESIANEINKWINT